MDNADTPTSRRLGRLPPSIVAILASAAVLLSVCPRGSRYSEPGITLDEPFNVQEGVRLAYGVPEWLTGRLTLREVWGDAEDQKPGRSPLGPHLSDHPPLGRLWIGLWHRAVANDDQVPFSIAAGRVGSAVAFGLTVFLVGLATARWYGTAAGLFASLALATMPRVFGHAHLAALETFTNLTFAAAVLSVAAFWKKQAPGWKTAVLTGALFGLALLSKMQAVFLPIPVAVWALWRYRARAILPLAIFGGIAFAVFFVGWPWLWLDPMSHLLEYFASTTERASLHAFYMGAQYVDREVPWHYPFVMFLVTVPVGWQLAGMFGSFKSASDPDDCWRRRLLGGAMLLPLIAFAVPGVVVYDGVRLFLVVFPLWAVFVGRGAAAVFDRLRQRRSRVLAVALIVALIGIQSVPLFLIRPCCLSYYNAFVGGTWGAEKLGFEMNYWGDAVTPEFLDGVADAAPAGSTVDVVPVLHALQLPAWRRQSGALRDKRISLRAYDPLRNAPSKYVLVFRRRAGLSPELELARENARVLAVVRRQGVVLAALYQLRD
ncbi:MAG: ArnT family glycosyltransferase [Planctomycetaceae bacterium]